MEQDIIALRGFKDEMLKEAGKFTDVAKRIETGAKNLVKGFKEKGSVDSLKASGRAERVGAHFGRNKNTYGVGAATFAAGGGIGAYVGSKPKSNKTT